MRPSPPYGIRRIGPPTATFGVARYARGMRPSRLALIVPLLVLALAGCGPATSPTTSFDPASACTTDGRFAGAYPDLEALLPAEFEGKPPATVDSGRNCTPAALGTLAGAGIDGVRFAGATWPMGGTSGLTVAVFEGDGLDAATMLAFYEHGAAQANRTEKQVTSDTSVGGVGARRLDVLGSDGTGQTIVAWPGDVPDRVNVLLAADVGDAKVTEALEAFGGERR
jgi:hypothetical protein